MDQTPETPLAQVDVSPHLAALVAQFPLPAAVPDCDVNQAELAEAFNVTTVTVGKWVGRSVESALWSKDRASECPVVQKGGPGKPYVIRISHVWAWREYARAQDEARDSGVRRSVAALQASLLNVDAQSLSDGLTVKERRDLVDYDFARNRAAELRRALVRVDEVAELVASLFEIVANGLDGMPDRLERELGLKPEQVHMVARISDDIRNALILRIEEAELQERVVDDASAPDRALI